MQKKDLHQFQLEFLEIVENSLALTKLLSMPKSIDMKVKKFEHILSEFNKKYGDLKLEKGQKVEKSILRIFIKKDDLLLLLKEHFLKIPGLRTIGGEGYDEADISHSEEFEEVLKHINDKVYISYQFEGGSCSCILRREKKRLEILYVSEDLFKKNSPLMLLLSRLALENMRPEIDIFKKDGHLGFKDLLSEDEKRQVLKKFEPRFLE